MLSQNISWSIIIVGDKHTQYHCHIFEIQGYHSVAEDSGLLGYDAVLSDWFLMS